MTAEFHPVFNSDPLNVVVRLSQGHELGETMKRLRIWLDSQKIRPTVFKTMPDAKGFTFAISFRDVQDADRFRARFAAKLPAPGDRTEEGVSGHIGDAKLQPAELTAP